MVSYSRLVAAYLSAIAWLLSFYPSSLRVPTIGSSVLHSMLAIDPSPILLTLPCGSWGTQDPTAAQYGSLTTVLGSSTTAYQGYRTFLLVTLGMVLAAAALYLGCSRYWAHQDIEVVTTIGDETLIGTPAPVKKKGDRSFFGLGNGPETPIRRLLFNPPAVSPVEVWNVRVQGVIGEIVAGQDGNTSIPGIPVAYTSTPPYQGHHEEGDSFGHSVNDIDTSVNEEDSQILAGLSLPPRVLSAARSAKARRPSSRELTAEVPDAAIQTVPSIPGPQVAVGQASGQDVKQHLDSHNDAPSQNERTGPPVVSGIQPAVRVAGVRRPITRKRAATTGSSAEALAQLRRLVRPYTSTGVQTDAPPCKAYNDQGTSAEDLVESSKPVQRCMKSVGCDAPDVTQEEKEPIEKDAGVGNDSRDSIERALTAFEQAHSDDYVVLTYAMEKLAALERAKQEALNRTGPPALNVVPPTPPSVQSESLESASGLPRVKGSSAIPAPPSKIGAPSKTSKANRSTVIIASREKETVSVITPTSQTVVAAPVIDDKLGRILAIMYPHIDRLAPLIVKNGPFCTTILPPVVIKKLEMEKKSTKYLLTVFGPVEDNFRAIFHRLDPKGSGKGFLQFLQNYFTASQAEAIARYLQTYPGLHSGSSDSDVLEYVKLLDERQLTTPKFAVHHKHFESMYPMRPKTEFRQYLESNLPKEKPPAAEQNGNETETLRILKVLFPNYERLAARILQQTPAGIPSKSDRQENIRNMKMFGPVEVEFKNVFHKYRPNGSPKAYLQFLRCYLDGMEIDGAPKVSLLYDRFEREHPNGTPRQWLDHIRCHLPQVEAELQAKEEKRKRPVSAPRVLAKKAVPNVVPAKPVKVEKKVEKRPSKVPVVTSKLPLKPWNGGARTANGKENVSPPKVRLCKEKQQGKAVDSKAPAGKVLVFRPTPIQRAQTGSTSKLQTPPARGWR